MIEITAKNIKEVEERLGSFRNKAPLVISRALNRAADNVKTNAAKKAREEYEIKAKDVKDTLRIIKANKSSLGAEVRSKGARIPLIKFKVKPNEPRPSRPPKILKVAVKKTSLKGLVGAFVAEMKNEDTFGETGHIGVYERVKGKYIKGHEPRPKKRGIGMTKGREAIRQLFGPAVPQMLGNPEVKKYIENEAMKVYYKRLDHEIDHILGVDKK